MKDIKNIIFDLGTVIVDVDPELTIERLRQYGAKNSDRFYNNSGRIGLIDDFEKGLISNAEFRNNLREQMEFTLSDDQIDEAWNAMLIGFPEKHIALLDKLSNIYNLFLLSNTDGIHLKTLYHFRNKDFEKEKLIDSFTKEYYSYKLKMLKPDPEIFHFVLDDSSLLPAETVFIDDVLENVESAKRLGMNGIHIPHVKSFTSLFDDDYKLRVT